MSTSTSTAATATARPNNPNCFNVCYLVGSQPYVDWATELFEHFGGNNSSATERALALLAEEVGFRPPPRRLLRTDPYRQPAQH